MDTYKETFETWDKIAGLYQDKFMHLDLYHHSYDFFSALLSQANSSILEIGCGPGNIAKYLLSKRPDFVITAIDTSPRMIALAKANNPSANFIVMDAREINKLESKYDAVIAGFCIPYLSKQDCTELIKNCRNLLLGEQAFYISFVEGDYNASGFIAGSSGDRTYFYYHSLDFIKQNLAENDFEIETVENINYTRSNGDKEIHTIVIAKHKNQKQHIQINTMSDNKKLSFETTILQVGNNTGICVPNEIVEQLGAGKKPPVNVTVNDFSYRNTIAVMGGKFMIGVSADIRSKTGIKGGDKVTVQLELDTLPREVTLPADFAAALEKNATAKSFFETLSYSNKQRYVLPIGQAKTEETRQRRIEKAVADLSEGKK